LEGDFVRPGGAVGFPWPGVVVGRPGVADGVALGVVGVVVGDVLGVGVAVGLSGVDVATDTLAVATTGRTEAGPFVASTDGRCVAGRSSFGVTRGAGCCRPASGNGSHGVSTRGPPTTLLTSSTTYPTTGTATTAPQRRILR